MQVSRRTNVERSQETTHALLTAARALFVEHGYNDTSTPEIARKAGVTRGALYHHYADKKAIFEAVLYREAEAVSAAINQSEEDGGTSDAMAILINGIAAYLKAMQVQGRTRLLLVDGPAILGREVMEEIDRRHAAGQLLLGMREALFPQPDSMPGNMLEILAELISAALDRAALAVSEGRDPVIYLNAVEVILDGIRAKFAS